MRIDGPARRYETYVGDRVVLCRTAEDRRLLLDAQVIASDPSDAKHFTIGRLILMKEACQFYCEGRLQRAVAQAIRKIHD